MSEIVDMEASRLHVAVVRGNSENIQRLLDNGVNVDGTPDQPSPLSLAAAVGSLDIAQLLLRNGANVHGNSEYPRPLTSAIIYGHHDIANVLLQHGANVEGDANGFPPLISAIHKDRCDLVELLLQNGACVEGGSDELFQGEPLDLAIRKGHRDIVELLLQKGASVEGKPNSMTPLHVAIKGGHRETIELLLRNGANVNGRDQFDQISHLIAAIEGGHSDIVERFLHDGDDLHDDSWYLHFLSVAAQKGHLRLVKILLSHGIRLDVKLNLDRLLQEEADWEEPCQLFQHPQVFQHLLESCACNPEFMKATGVSERLCSGEERFDGHCPETSLLPAVYLHHLIKIATINLQPLDGEPSEVTEFWQCAGGDWNSFRKECMSEVALMKKMTVTDTNDTFFNILMKDAYQVARYVRNRNVAQILTSNDLEDLFPKFASILKCQFQKGNQRILAVKEGIKACHSLSSLFKKLPHEINEVILSYLSEKDLLALKEANPCTSL